MNSSGDKKSREERKRKDTNSKNQLQSVRHKRLKGKVRKKIMTTNKSWCERQTDRDPGGFKRTKSSVHLKC